MTLFVFRPECHGEETFMVMSDSEKNARLSIINMINSWSNDIEYDYSATVEQFQSDYYKMETYQINEVAINSND